MKLTKTNKRTPRVINPVSNTKMSTGVEQRATFGANTPQITKQVPNKKIFTYKEKRADETYTEFTLKYVLVNSLEIINLCSPEYNYRPKNWSDTTEINKRIEVGQKYIHLMNKNIGFYDKLEESILQNGFKNPILLTSGYPKFRSLEEIPPQLRVRPEEMLVCEIIGGSRLLIAQKHKMLIPAIVNDYTNMFPDGQELKTKEDIAKCFSDTPKEILITNRGLRISPPKHIHLDKNNQEPSFVMETRRRILKGSHN